MDDIELAMRLLVHFLVFLALLRLLFLNFLISKHVQENSNPSSS